MSKIGFIGLGNMGGPMALNLLKAGHQLKVFDLSAKALETAAAEGADVADSAVAAVEGVDVVISMLPAGQHVQSLYLQGDAALFQHIKPRTLVVDSSTIEVSIARELHASATQHGLVFVDAPVSGGVGGARAGTLSFMVGGEAAAFELALPLLSDMGKNIFHAGGAGAGQIAKCCNNMLLAIQMIGTAEALNMGVRNGLDASTLSEIMQQSSGNNWALQVYNPYPGVMPNVPAANDYQGGFQVNLMAKDLGLAMQLGQQSQSATPLGAHAKSLYDLHRVAGKGTLDFSSILKLLNGS